MLERILARMEHAPAKTPKAPSAIIPAKVAILPVSRPSARLEIIHAKDTRLVITPLGTLATRSVKGHAHAAKKNVTANC